MADAKKRSGGILELPLDKLEHINGFTLDFGHSVVKIAYLSNEDWENGKPVSGDLGRVRLISFAREEFDEGLGFLKRNCFMRRNSEDDKPLMYTCGLGGNQFGTKIEETLNVKTKNVNELRCFQGTLEYCVDNMSLEEFTLSTPQEMIERTKCQMKQRIQIAQNLAKSNLFDLELKDDVMEIFNQEENTVFTENTKPYLMAIGGSNWMVFQPTKNGKHFMISIATFGGRSFFALGCLLTGVKTYDELMALAEKGNHLNLKANWRNLLEKTSDSKQESDYSEFVKEDPRLGALWAKSVGKDLSEFRKEDIARSLLHSMVQVLVSNLYNACVITRIRHIFLGGSFMSHPLTQRLLMEEFQWRRWESAATIPGVDADYHLHILKDGGHFGALGAILNQSNTKET